MDLLLATTLRALMIRRNWNAYRSFIQAETFPNTNAAAVYHLIAELHGTGKRNITEATLRLAIDASVSEVRAKELHAAVDSIMEVKRSELANVDSSIRNFAARGLAFKAARMVVTHADNPSFDFTAAAKLMTRASVITEAKLFNWKNVLDAGLPGDPEMTRSYIPLGLHPALDAELCGGVGRGELLIFLAPPERGKTSYLWRVATNAVLAGERVMAYTLEIARYKAFLRYYQCLTGMTITEMATNRQFISMRRSQAAKVGKLWVSDFSASTFTPSMLDADLEQMADEGMKPSYVMIDYLELMRPSGAYGRGRDSLSLGEMVQETRQIAMRYQVPIVSAWQVNRIGGDKEVFTREHISECWETVKIADIILGLNQGPMEMINETMRLKTMKQREDPSRKLYYLASDMRRMIIKPKDGFDDGNNAKEAVE